MSMQMPSIIIVEWLFDKIATVTEIIENDYNLITYFENAKTLCEQWTMNL